MTTLLDDHLLTREKTYVFLSVSLYLWIAITLAGVIFKIQHWPGGSIFTTLGAAGLTGYSFSGWRALKGSDGLNNAFCILAILWFLRILVGILFFVRYPLSWPGIFIYAAFAGLTFGIYEYIKKRKLNTDDAGI